MYNHQDMPTLLMSTTYLSKPFLYPSAVRFATFIALRDWEIPSNLQINCLSIAITPFI